MISGHPESGFLFTIIPLIFLILLWKQIRGSSALHKFGYHGQVGLFRGYVTMGYVKSLLFILAMTLILLSLYDFRWGRETESRDQRGNDIALVLDLSYSMMAADSNPTRLEAARESLLLLLHGEGNNRFSFIPFKGKALIAVPLTEDRVVLENYVSLSNPTWISSPGSNLENALREALKSLDSNQDRNKIVVIATDGEELSGNAMKVIREWIPKDISVMILGAGSIVPVQVELSEGDWLTDENGDRVETRLEEGSLQEMARVSDGKYFSLNEAGSQKNLENQLLQWSQPHQGIRYVRPQQFRVFLLPAIFLLWIYQLIGRLPWAKKYW